MHALLYTLQAIDKSTEAFNFEQILMRNGVKPARSRTYSARFCFFRQSLPYLPGVNLHLVFLIWNIDSMKDVEDSRTYEKTQHRSHYEIIRIVVRPL